MELHHNKLFCRLMVNLTAEQQVQPAKAHPADHPADAELKGDHTPDNHNQKRPHRTTEVKGGMTIGTFLRSTGNIHPTLPALHTFLA